MLRRSDNLLAINKQVSIRGAGKADNVCCFGCIQKKRLTDATKRKELMVIYIEDLAPQGMTPTELQDGGTRANEWPQVESATLEKIARDMTLMRL